METTNFVQFDEPVYDYGGEHLQIKQEEQQGDPYSEPFFKPTRATLFYCDRCEFVDDDVEKLNLHQQQQHFSGSPTSRFMCTICNKDYVDAKSIKRHLLRIHGVDPPPGTTIHQCSECHQRFSDKSHLTRHYLKHSGERPHNCSLCSKSFSRKEHLNRHLICVHGVVKEAKRNADSSFVITPKAQNQYKYEPETLEMPTLPTTLIPELTPAPLQTPTEGTLLHLQFSLSDLNVPVSNDQYDDPSQLAPSTAEALLNQVFPRCQICDKKFLNKYLTRTRPL